MWARDNVLYGGSGGISQRHVWAVGYYRNSSINQTLMEHWNGFISSRWSAIQARLAASSGWRRYRPTMWARNGLLRQRQRT